MMNVYEFVGLFAFMLLVMFGQGFILGYYWKKLSWVNWTKKSKENKEIDEEKEIISNYMEKAKPYYEARRKKFKI